jgi:hypothetical protein
MAHKKGMTIKGVSEHKGKKRGKRRSRKHSKK